MTEAEKTRVAVNGYGVIGKRVAAAVTLQEDMSLAGVSDVVTDWRAHTVIRNGFRLFGATQEHLTAMRQAGLPWISRPPMRIVSWVPSTGSGQRP